MIIETMNNPEHGIEIKFENLESGTVFEFARSNACLSGPGPKALKLGFGKYVLLTYSDDVPYFDLGDGSMVRNRKITKVWGKLVGLKVRL